MWFDKWWYLEQRLAKHLVCCYQEIITQQWNSLAGKSKYLQAQNPQTPQTPPLRDLWLTHWLTSQRPLNLQSQCCRHRVSSCIHCSTFWCNHSNDVTAFQICVCGPGFALRFQQMLSYQPGCWTWLERAPQIYKASCFLFHVMIIIIVKAEKFDHESESESEWGDGKAS